MSNWKAEKSREEIGAALNRQIANMRRSFSAFDSGAFEEAERIAAAVYIICHDKGQQVSLLRQLNLKDGPIFFDTNSSYLNEPNVVTADPPLLSLSFDAEGSIRYAAGRVPAYARRVTFSKWWEGEVYNNASGKTLSRKNLIFFLRCQDGGGHVDPSLRDPSYYNFVKFGDHVAVSADGMLSVNSLLAGRDNTNVHWLTTRQIGAELDATLTDLGY